MTPVFFILIFGILEMGLAMNDSLAVASSVRAGSRLASTAGNDVKADLYTVLGTGREASAIRRSSIVRVVVYKPSGFGQGPSATCKAGTPVTGVCNVYLPADFTKAAVQVQEETDALAQNRAVDPAKISFGCKATSPDRYWCPNTRKVTRTGTGPEYVGVWMEMNHALVSGVGTYTIRDQSVIRLEPRIE